MKLDKNVLAFDSLRELGFKPLDITEALLTLNRVSRSAIREQAGVSPGTVSNTIKRRRGSANPAVMAAVSRKLGIPARELFDGQA